MSRIALGDIRYNPVTGAYEARVDINRKGRTYRYPCSVPGSLSMDDATVRRSLTQQAQTMAGRENGLLSVR
ncbi:orotidine 5'-phosphate decarboxylase [Pseudooctadecabacter sp.]|uniref:orotidine 5'-phosphate decarboxylase n=1 Tax=Pseudooctadecabacter sp. TaxID=1966338 RepID=UPI0025D20F4C|nr:orotidine 5'-phosphate decarboxylase [Pseudooctadecabacter sp.]